MHYIVAAGPRECGVGFLDSWLNSPGKVDGRLKAATSSLMVRARTSQDCQHSTAGLGACASSLMGGWAPGGKRLKGEFQNDTCQWQYYHYHSRTRSQKCLPLVSPSQAETQLLPAPLGSSPKWAHGSHLGSFQTTASALEVKGFEILCTFSKRGVLVSNSSLALMNVSPAAFQSQTFWELVFLVQDLWAEKANVRLRPTTPSWL